MKNANPHDFKSALARIRADYRGMTPSYRGIAEYAVGAPIRARVYVCSTARRACSIEWRNGRAILGIG